MNIKLREQIIYLFEKLGITQNSLKRLNKKYNNNYIRAINYHEVYDNEVENFEKQIQYFSELFCSCTFDDLKSFLLGKKMFKEKPGLLITFDDGLVGNYLNALNILEKYGFKGMFLVPAGTIDINGFMSKKQLVDLLDRGHYVGCHTFSHHRMNISDSSLRLQYEIKDSKDILEKILNTKIDTFCWVGGENNTYTNKAYKTIVASGYNYALMTDSYPILPNANPYHIHRTNIQTYWSLSTVLFQISGIMDKKYKRKRIRDERITQ